MTTKIRDRVLSPPLVITALFGPATNARTPGYGPVRAAVLVWLTKSQAAQRLLRKVDQQCSEKALLEQIALFETRFEHALFAGEVSAAAFAKHFDAIESASFCNGQCKTLAAMLRHIASITASEASAERAFSRLSLTVPKRRRSLLPQSASMALRANVYSAAAAATDARTTTRTRPAHAAPAAAAAADAAPAFDLRPTIDAIIALAWQKLEAIAQLTGRPVPFVVVATVVAIVAGLLLLRYYYYYYYCYYNAATIHHRHIFSAKMLPQL
jgi:hypothetical protein